MLHGGTSKAIYTPRKPTGVNCLQRNFLAMEGQDQKSSGKQNCEALVTFYMLIVVTVRCANGQSLIAECDLRPVLGYLFEQIAQSIYRRRIGFEETINNLLQLSARNRIELEISFLGLGSKFRIFQRRLKSLSEELHAILRCTWREGVEIGNGSDIMQRQFDQLPARVSLGQTDCGWDIR